MPPESQQSDRYNAREAEGRWQAAWDAQGIFRTPNADPRPKFDVLEMRAAAMGWDAFGMMSYNAAQ